MALQLPSPISWMISLLKSGSSTRRAWAHPEGMPRKGLLRRLTDPILSVQKSFDQNQINVGDEVKVTITVKNTGTGQAQNINVEDLPPLPEFSYVAGYPPKIKDTLDPGESDSAVYVMSAVKEGSIRVPAVLVSYTDSKEERQIK